MPGRVQAGRELVEADVWLVPRAEETAARLALDRLDEAQVLRRCATRPRRHHSVGTIEVVREGLVADVGEAPGFFSDGLLRVQDGRVVELGERVDEELPVAPDVGAVAMHLGELVERVPLEALGELAEVVP